MAANSIASALGLERAAVDRAMESCGLSPAARGETIDLEGFARLALTIAEHRG